MNETRLFVGNLPFRILENELLDHFAQAGVVSAVQIVFDKATGRSRGFAFVDYATAEEAHKAVEMFHNQDFQGRALTVNLARPREDLPPQRDRGSE